MEEAEQPPHDAYVYAIRDEGAYLQAVDEKRPTPPEPMDPASILCQFCGKSWEHVPMLFQAKRRTMDPNTSAIVAVWICNECVTQVGQILAAEPPGTRGLHWWQAWSYRTRPKAQLIRPLIRQVWEPRRRRMRSINCLLPRLLGSLI